MKRMFCVFMILALTSCATMGIQITRPEYCTNQKSLIYDTFERVQIDPQTIGGLLVTANYIALTSGLYDAKTCLVGLSTIEYVLSGKPPTYLELMSIFTEHFGMLNGTKAAMAVSFVIPYMPTLKSTNLVSDCDRMLILKQIADQRQMVGQLPAEVPNAQ